MLNIFVLLAWLRTVVYIVCLLHVLCNKHTMYVYSNVYNVYIVYTVYIVYIYNVYSIYIFIYIVSVGTYPPPV